MGRVSVEPRTEGPGPDRAHPATPPAGLTAVGYTVVNGAMLGTVAVPLL